MIGAPLGMLGVSFTPRTVVVAGTWQRMIDEPARTTVDPRPRPVTLGARSRHGTAAGSVRSRSRASSSSWRPRLATPLRGPARQLGDIAMSLEREIRRLLLPW